MALLEVKDLDKAFTAGDKTITAIDKLSFSIEESEFVSIVGPSGCGKSTFLHIVGGFEPASGGKILLSGRPIGRPGPDRGMMFQDLSLFPWLTAIENVAMPLTIRREPPAVARAAAEQMLARVSLEHRGRHLPGELSGGERQRVALARALVTKPQCVLADEPTGNLDRRTAWNVFELMLELNRAIGTSLVIVTHDPEIAARAERILHLADGVLKS